MSQEDSSKNARIDCASSSSCKLRRSNRELLDSIKRKFESGSPDTAVKFHTIPKTQEAVAKGLTYEQLGMLFPLDSSINLNESIRSSMNFQVTVNSRPTDSGRKSPCIQTTLNDKQFKAGAISDLGETQRTFLSPIIIAPKGDLDSRDIFSLKKETKEEKEGRKYSRVSSTNSDSVFGDISPREKDDLSKNSYTSTPDSSEDERKLSYEMKRDFALKRDPPARICHNINSTMFRPRTQQVDAVDGRRRFSTMPMPRSPLP